MTNRRPIPIVELDWIKSFAGEIPSLDYVLPGLLAGTTGAIVAQSSTGKSFFALGLAIAITTKDMLGYGINPENACVTYITAEDPIEILQHRAMSLGLHLTRDERERVPTYVKVVTLHGHRPQILDSNARRVEVWIKWLKDQAYGCRLLILDTIRKFHTADENLSGPMTILTQILDEIASQTGCAVVFLHHTSKAATLNGQGGDQGASRGSSALTDNIRWQINLSKMTADQASRNGVDDDQRHNYVKVIGSKLNYGPGHDEIWLKRSQGGVLVAADLGTKKKNIKIRQLYEPK